MSDIIKKNPIENPQVYFENKKNELNDRIDAIKLSKEEEDKIVKSETTKIIRDKALGLFKIGEIINTFLNWNDEIDKGIREFKKEHLLNSYFEKSDQSEDSIKKITQFLSDPVGNTIFNKILRILDNTPPDGELSNHLSTVLKRIIDSDFKSLFEDHKYALNQIEMLTPQSLALLSDFSRWRGWQLGNYTGMNGKITSNWVPLFVDAYSNYIGINEEKLKTKISHSMDDLIKNRYVNGMVTTKDGIGAAFLTEIGKLVYGYIKQNPDNL